MTTFDKREEAFEKKFVVDEELKFKAEARRNRLTGLWAAAKLGYQPELGMPSATIDGVPIYKPWLLFVWWFHFDAYAPGIFSRAGEIAATSGFLGCGAAVAKRRFRETLRPHGVFGHYR